MKRRKKKLEEKKRQDHDVLGNGGTRARRKRGEGSRWPGKGDRNCVWKKNTQGSHGLYHKTGRDGLLVKIMRALPLTWQLTSKMAEGTEMGTGKKIRYGDIEGREASGKNDCQGREQK